MNRIRVAASSRDAALRASQRKLQEYLIAPATPPRNMPPNWRRGLKLLVWSIRWRRWKAKPTAAMPMPANT
jgi:hypothetical protein